MFRILLSLFMALFFLSSCGDDESQAEKDQQIILDYITENNLDATEGEDGLYYIIESPGTGGTPTINSTVTVAYTGYFTNGDIFDSSDSNGITFPLTNVIEGWQLGIPQLKEGGTGILLIPSSLGYGTSGQGSIPGNTVLLFDVELLGIVQ